MSLSEDIIKYFDEAKDYIELVDKLTLQHTQTLDNIIKEISKLMEQPDYLLDIDNIQNYYLKLSTELYILVDKLKKYEIYSSLAKSKETEAYNNAYLKASTPTDGAKKPTVNDLQIQAIENSKKESLISVIYSSALKSIKSKIDAGNNVADTLKNILKTKVSIDFTSNQLNNRSN